LEVDAKKTKVKQVVMLTEDGKYTCNPQGPHWEAFLLEYYNIVSKSKSAKDDVHTDDELIIKRKGNKDGISDIIKNLMEKYDDEKSGQLKLGANVIGSRIKNTVKTAFDAALKHGAQVVEDALKQSTVDGDISKHGEKVVVLKSKAVDYWGKFILVDPLKKQK
jgi:hypothetical protein